MPVTAVPTKPKPAPRPKTEIDILGDQLGSPDANTQQAALDKINEILNQPAETDDEGRPKAAKVKVNPKWLTVLLKSKRYDDVEVMAMRGIVMNASDAKTIGVMQKSRVQTFIAAGKYDAALAAAKAYYNVCGMAETESAIDLVSISLLNARPNEKGLARKFKAQQVAMATTQPAADPVAQAGENILKTITVDGKAFEAAAKEITFNDYSNLIAKGNLLLLCDQAKEAKECFEAAGDLAKGEKQMSAVTESIARSIRAESGAIGPANTYILAQQGK